MLHYGQWMEHTTNTFNMKYKFQIVISGKLHSFFNESRSSVYAQAVDLLKKNNINYSSKEIYDMIDRQSKQAVKIKKPSLMEAFNGAKALVRFTQGKSVEFSEIARRISICKACPFYGETSGCKACGAAATAAKLVNNIKVLKGMESQIPKEIQDKFCGFCGCSIPLLTVTRFDDFIKEEPKKNLTRPDHCWIKTTSPNHKP